MVSLSSPHGHKSICSILKLLIDVSPQVMLVSTVGIQTYMDQKHFFLIQESSINAKSEAV